MSAFNDVDIECSNCAETFRGGVWTAVHAGEDPELKDLLLGGELNMVMCTSCSHVTHQEGFLLYQDPALELVVYVHPPDQEERAEELQKMMLKGYHDAQATLDPSLRRPYEPIQLFGLSELAELVRERDKRKLEEDIERAKAKT